MNINDELTDGAVLTELGSRLAQHRIALGLTQAEAAREAGVAKRTLERLEAGQPVQTPTLVRVLRQLRLLGLLDTLLPSTAPGPVEMLRGRETPRKRAPRTRARPGAKPWRWGDDR